MFRGRRSALFASACLAAASLLSGAPAKAAPDGPVAPAASRAELRQKEDAARLEASKELGRLAAFDALKSAFDDARRDYGRALAFAPKDAALAAELEKIKGRASSVQTADADVIAQRRAAALAKCAELLEPAATAYAAGDLTDELGALLALLREQDVPVDGLVKKLDLVVFEPYLDLRTKSAVAKLEAGWEYVDGEWQEPTKVAELDKAHSTWKSPWVFSDEFHEVRTNLPRRTGRQMLAQVAAYRRFFLSYFAGEWDLRPPAVKLPIIVTRTWEELEERCKANGDRVLFGAAAFYVRSRPVGNPCYVSLQLKRRSGEPYAIDYSYMREIFEHELGHQIGFEYSLFAKGRAHGSRNFKWVVEGVADFLPNYDLVDGAWKLVRAKWRGPEHDQHVTGLGWCRDHIDKIPPLTEFVGIADTFLGSEDRRNYNVANALSGYLLEGKNREYRQRFVELVQAVHREAATPAHLEKCFPGDSLYDLDAEFRLWLKHLELDDD
jgi:hypothetical protein